MRPFGARFFTAARARAAPAVTVTVAVSVAILVAPASVSVAGGLELKKADVDPGRAYFAGRPLTIGGVVADEQERPLRVAIVSKRTRAVIRHWTLTTSPERTRFELPWDGRNDDRGVARDGRYAVRAAPAGRPTRRLGSFVWRRHAYPVAGPHHDRGYWGEFGAPRSDGREHQGFDVNAACGTPVVAARGGRVLKAKFDPKLMGNFLVVKGRHESLRYLYAHLRDPSPVRKGQRIRTNRLIGRVGLTGNAAGTPCHLHIELRDDGPVDPEPYLRRWDR